MKAMLACGVALLLGAGSAQAQGLSIGLRGGAGLPLGSFASTTSSTTGDEALIQGAKTGFGYGLDVGLGFTPAVGLYAGFDHVQFDCDDEQCGSQGKYTLGGVSAGLKLSPMASSPVHPWLKAGVTLADLKGEYGAGSTRKLTTDRRPGYEIAAGLDVPLLGFFALEPQVRYVGQNAHFDVPGVSVEPTTAEQTVSYLKFELGLGLALGHH